MLIQVEMLLLDQVMGHDGRKVSNAETYVFFLILYFPVIDNILIFFQKNYLNATKSLNLLRNSVIVLYV